MRHRVLERGAGRHIRSAIESHLNIIILPAETGSGKDDTCQCGDRRDRKECSGDRLVILEDTAENQCAAKNAVLLHQRPRLDMSRL